VSAPVDTVPGGVVAVSSAMRAVLDLVRRLGETRSPVLVTGESGSGKDLVAHWLHYRGPRRDGPFIKVHCPSIPEELLESELFGHERGAFTDAKQAKAGKIEMAHAGTLYFDQVQDLRPTLQAKLLRVVEERRFERLGGTRTLEVDVRFVSSAGTDLRTAVASGTFREDLFHRLSVVPVELPPLRSRPEDILPLAELFLARERSCSWPGSASAAPPRPRPSPRRPRACSGATAGRGTCGSSRASWSARPSSPQRGRSRSRRCRRSSARSRRHSGRAGYVHRR
jgi:transcriptional regulator with GAF, ATPase, and Fis domain